MSKSIFQTELEANLALGMPFYVAKQRAIDYYRRYTRREIISDLTEGSAEGTMEVSPDAVMMGEGNFLDANVTAESRVMFNQLFRLFLEYAEEWTSGHPDNKKVWYDTKRIAVKDVCRIARCGNLEHLLDEDLQEVVGRELGESVPWNDCDLAEICGYELRKGKRMDNVATWNLKCWRDDFRTYASHVSKDYYEQMGA